MSPLTFGDLSTQYLTRLQNVRLKTMMGGLGQELASGETGNLRRATRGDLGNFAGIVNALSTLDAYQTTAAEAALITEATQRSLEVVQQSTAEVGPALLLAGSSNEATLVQSTAADAKAKFETVVSVLNSRVAGRALLAGTAVGGTALADAATMLADIQAAISAETTAVGVTAVVDAWFDDPGGGFETVGYLGDTTDLAPFRIGPNEEAGYSLRADNQAIRDLLKGYAMASLVADGALSGLHEERVALVESAGTRLLTSDKGVAEVRASVGVLENRIDGARTRNGAEISALQIARSEIVRVDPYEAASELQAVETQLEAVEVGHAAETQEYRLTPFHHAG